jgi:hypothetical protein
VPKGIKSSGGTGGETWEQFRSMSAMPQYQGKSHEELRLEDYHAGVKGKPGAQSFQPVHPNKVQQPRMLPQPGHSVKPCLCSMHTSLVVSGCDCFTVLEASLFSLYLSM